MLTRATRRRTVLVVALAIALAGCGAGGGTSPGAPSSPGDAPSDTAPASAPAAGSPDPAPPTPIPGSVPPAAELQVPGRPPAAGDLGTYSWDGLVSDAPWIVGRMPTTLGSGGSLEVMFSPALAHASWRARWAPVSGGQAGVPHDAGSGTTGVLRIERPPGPGSWSLQVSAGFGPGRSATWYWRVEVGP